MTFRSTVVPLCAALLILLSAPAGGNGAPPDAPPRFEDHPAGPAFTGRGRLVLGRADRGYRTRLREFARGPADFAGHYVLALWGCGTECLTGAAIDRRSGRVVWLPGGTLCCWYSGAQSEAQDLEPARYRLDSRLLILNGVRNEREGDLGEHYYRIEGGRFVHLADRPPRPAGPGPAAPDQGRRSR